MCVQNPGLGGQVNGMGGAICPGVSSSVGLLSLLLCPSGCWYIAAVFVEAFHQTEEEHPEPEGLLVTARMGARLE